MTRQANRYFPFVVFHLCPGRSSPRGTFSIWNKAVRPRSGTTGRVSCPCSWFVFLPQNKFKESNGLSTKLSGC